MGFLQRLVFSLLGNGALFWLLTNKVFVDSFQITGGLWGCAFVAAMFGLLNFLIKPLLVLVTLPVQWITLGLFSFVINAGMLWLLEQVVNFLQLFDTTFTIQGWVTYAVAGAILTVFNTLLHWFEE